MSLAQLNVDESVCGVINATLAKMGVRHKIEDLIQNQNEIYAKHNEIELLNKQVEFLKSNMVSQNGGAHDPWDYTVSEREVSGVIPFLSGSSTVPVFEWNQINFDIPPVNPKYIVDRKAVCGVLNGITNNVNTWLFGPTGCGKDEAVKYVANKLNLPVITISFDGDISRTELIGRDHLRVNAQGATYSEFLESVLPKALRQPCILLLDEFDFIREDVAYVMQTVLNEGRLNILEKEGETIIRHPHCYVVATANTNGKYDDMNRYGARELSSAVLDRFTNWVQMDYMNISEYESFIEKIGKGKFSKEAISNMAMFIVDYQAMFKHGDTITPLTNRTIVSTFERAIDDDDIAPTLEYTFMNRLSDFDRQKAIELLDKTTGAK